MADFQEGDVVRLGATMIYDSTEEVANIYYLLITGGGDKTFAQADAGFQDWMDAVMETLDTELSDLMLADRISVANVTQLTVFGNIPWGVFTQGGAAGEQTPSGACCLTFARTHKPRVQIRKYYGVFPVAALVDGEWDGGVTAACGAALDYHIQEHAMTNGMEMRGVAYNREFGTHEFAHSVATRGEPAYQRRRKRGVGS